MRKKAEILIHESQPAFLKRNGVYRFPVVENPPGIGATALAVAINVRLGHTLDESKLVDGAIYYAPQWIMTYDNMAEKLEETKDMPDSTSISSYLSVDEALESYFVD